MRPPFRLFYYSILLQMLLCQERLPHPALPQKQMPSFIRCRRSIVIRQRTLCPGGPGSWMAKPARSFLLEANCLSQQFRAICRTIKLTVRRHDDPGYIFHQKRKPFQQAKHRAGKYIHFCKCNRFQKKRPGDALASPGQSLKFFPPTGSFYAVLLSRQSRKSALMT